MKIMKDIHKIVLLTGSELMALLFWLVENSRLKKKSYGFLLLLGQILNT